MNVDIAGGGSGVTHFSTALSWHRGQTSEAPSGGSSFERPPTGNDNLRAGHPADVFTDLCVSVVLVTEFTQLNIMKQNKGIKFSIKSFY